MHDISDRSTTFLILTTRCTWFRPRHWARPLPHTQHSHTSTNPTFGVTPTQKPHASRPRSVFWKWRRSKAPVYSIYMENLMTRSRWCRSTLCGFTFLLMSATLMASCRIACLGCAEISKARVESGVSQGPIAPACRSPSYPRPTISLPFILFNLVLFHIWGGGVSNGSQK